MLSNIEDKEINNLHLENERLKIQINNMQNEQREILQQNETLKKLINELYVQVKVMKSKLWHF